MEYKVEGESIFPLYFEELLKSLYSNCTPRFLLLQVSWWGKSLFFFISLQLSLFFFWCVLSLHYLSIGYIWPSFLLFRHGGCASQGHLLNCSHPISFNCHATSSHFSPKYIDFELFRLLCVAMTRLGPDTIFGLLVFSILRYKFTRYLSILFNNLFLYDNLTTNIFAWRLAVNTFYAI